MRSGGRVGPVLDRALGAWRAPRAPRSSGTARRPPPPWPTVYIMRRRSALSYQPPTTILARLVPWREPRGDANDRRLAAVLHREHPRQDPRPGHADPGADVRDA